MDIKAMVNEAAEKIMKDKKLQEQFMKDPVKAVESLTGVDLPDGVTDQVVSAVKAKMAGSKLMDGFGAVKKLL